jgi:hypothetical protein
MFVGVTFVVRKERQSYSRDPEPYVIWQSLGIRSQPIVYPLALKHLANQRVRFFASKLDDNLSVSHAREMKSTRGEGNRASA